MYRVCTSEEGGVLAIGTYRVWFLGRCKAAWAWFSLNELQRVAWRHSSSRHPGGGCIVAGTSFSSQRGGGSRQTDGGHGGQAGAPPPRPPH